jgi:hypothetical protein
MRIEHDDSLMNVVEACNEALEKYGLVFQDDKLEHDGYMIYELQQTSRLKIVAAVYGAESNYVDVTSVLQSLVKEDSLIVKVYNSTFNIDPAPGVVKALRVTYRLGERVKTVVIRESETLVIEEGDPQ